MDTFFTAAHSYEGGHVAAAATTAAAAAMGAAAAGTAMAAGGDSEAQLDTFLTRSNATASQAATWLPAPSAPDIPPLTSIYTASGSTPGWPSSPQHLPPSYITSLGSGAVSTAGITSAQAPAPASSASHR